jgi:hypothetical protein
MDPSSSPAVSRGTVRTRFMSTYRWVSGREGRPARIQNSDRRVWSTHNVVQLHL